MLVLEDQVTVLLKNFINKLTNLSIKWKIQAILVATSLIMLFTSFVVISLNTISDFRTDLEQHADLIALVTGASSTDALVRNQPAKVNRTLTALDTIPDLNIACIYDQHENLFASYKDDPKLLLPDSISTQATKYYLDGHLHIFKPIRDNNKTYGTIFLCFSTSGLNARIRDHWYTMLLFFVLLSLFAIFIANKLQSLISGPILRLAKTTEEIANLEDYSVKVKKMGKDEIGQLYDSFNIMLDQIYNRDLQRNQAMRALRDSEERYRKVFELSPNGILLHQENKIIYANPKLVELAGVTNRDEIIGKDIYDYIHSNYRNKVNQQLDQMEATGQGTPVIEGKFIRSDGELIDALVAGVSFGGGKSPTFLSVIQDITEIKKAEQALADSESRFRLIVENANDAMYVLSKKHFILVNPKMIELFGFTKEELLNPTFDPMKLIAPESHEFIIQRQKSFMAGNFVPEEYEFKGQDIAGNTYDIEANLTSILLDGEPAVLGMLRDVTEKNQLEVQLRQSQKMEAIGTLAGGIAHDFNNLLTVISGHIELAQLKLDDENPLKRHIGEIEKAGKRAQNLTRQLLAFSRKQIIKRKTIDLNEIIEDLEKMLKRLIGEDIEMKMKLKQKLPKVNADPGQIEQVMMNLIINSRDAIREQKTAGGRKQIIVETGFTKLDESSDMTIALKKSQKYVQISVTDTGCGMDKETKEKIFEPFFTTKGVGKGTGLGMATIYGIVKQNDGVIHVYSEPEKGTVIKIYWPVTEENLEPEIEVESTKQKDLFSGKESILFVEDDQGVREFAVDALRALGYTIFEAEHAQEALRLIEEENIKFDLLLTDVVMPGMSGKELADEIRQKRRDQKVLFASGYTRSNIVHGGILDEGVNFIHKPYSVRDLSKKVRLVLSQTETQLQESQD